MDEIHPFLILFFLVAATILIRLFIGQLNHARIREYIENNNGEVLGITWTPFGSGWYGERDSVIYQVRYKDGEGNVRQATCKTGIFSGVYFTQDSIVHRARQTQTTFQTPSPAAQSRQFESGLSLEEGRRLRMENLRLQDEIAELRRELAKYKG